MGNGERTTDNGLCPFVLMFLLIWLGLSTQGGLTQGDIDSLLTYANYLYNNRHLADSNFLRSQKIFQDILDLNPHNEEALKGMAEINYALGDKAKTQDKKLHFFNQGMVLAETLIKVNDKNPWGHFWFAANYGAICQIRGILKSLTGLKKIRAEFNRALELDPQNSDVIYALAILFLRVPSFAGGDREKGILYLKRAIQYDHKFTLPYLDLAEHYLKTKNYDKAKELLNTVIEMKDPKYPADYFLKDKPRAQKLLAKLKTEEK